MLHLLSGSQSLVSPVHLLHSSSILFQHELVHVANSESYNCIFSAQLYCPTGISRMGNSCRFPQRKSPVTESRYPTFGACWFFFSVSTIHRTPTWTTRFLTCACDLFAFTHGTSVYSLIRRTFVGYRIRTELDSGNLVLKPSTRRSPIHVVPTLDRA